MDHPQRPIVCATDFSASGEGAVELAVRAARAFGAPIVLAHVMDTGARAEPAPTGAVLSEAERVLRERVDTRKHGAEAALEAAARRHPDAPITTLLLDGRPAEALVAHAAAIDAQLIVIGPHGTSAHQHALRDATIGRLLGSTAERVLRTSRCPVLVAAGPP